MSAALRLLFIFTLVAYGVAYSWLDANMQQRPETLRAAPPLKLLQAVTGLFRQLNSEMMFVQTSIFLGGLKPQADESQYEVKLAHNLRTMNSLYPEFKDPYYYTNAFLAPISKYGAQQADLIFKTGIEAKPNNFILRFFHGANIYYNLQQPTKAAKAFEKAAELENAPPVFSHLAAVFLAQDGNLRAGLIILQTMLSTEKDEYVRERYLEEIACFEKAITIQKAVNTFMQEHGTPPQDLDQLVPKYLKELPKIEKRFVLVYEPPTVSLKRPD